MTRGCDKEPLKASDIRIDALQFCSFQYKLLRKKDETNKKLIDGMIVCISKKEGFT